jgi:predicted tellurium resistance membrane protein TerC
VALALVFGAGLWALEGAEAGEAYFAGYAMEKALSLDNVFVFTLISATLGVPRTEQPRILLWGILIALFLRGLFIFAGGEALETYSWVAWPFAALLVWTGWRILRSGEAHDEGARIVDRVRARFPALKPGATALAAVAVADMIFAVDSVPAILAITTDTFTALTLGVIVTVISVTVGASLLRERRTTSTAPGRDVGPRRPGRGGRGLQPPACAASEPFFASPPGKGS